MNNHFSRVLLWGVVVFIAGTISVSAISSQGILDEDLTLHKKSSSTGMMGQGASESKSTMYFGKSFIREAREGEEFIIFHDENRFITLNHTKKTYTELSFEELNKQLSDVSSQISEKSSENEKTMEMLQQMMGGKPGEITVEKIGPGEEIAGFQTTKYLINMAPLKIQMWAAPDLKIPSVYYDSMKIQAAPNPLFDMGKMFDAFKKIEGISLRTIVSMKVMGMAVESTDEVIEVVKGPVPEPEIPSGYQKVELNY